MTTQEYSLDPVTLEVLRNGLESIVDECFVALMKSAYSSNIKERRDHSVAMFDATGRLIAQAKESLPIHLGSLGGMIDELISAHPIDTLHEGDIFIGNDPHVAGGTHLPDLNFAMPVFYDGVVVCFICNIAHHSDFGGMIPGSMGGGMTEIYQEGLRLPVIRLFRAGQLVEDIFSVILLNTRIAEERRGDLHAQISACRLGERRFKELLMSNELSTVLTAFDELILRTKARIGLAIAEVPDGTYTFEDVMDDDGVNARDIPIKVTIKVEGESINLDFTGSSGQVPGNINCTKAATRSAIAYAIKAQLDPDVPNNEGVFSAIQWSVPNDSILNASYPTAVASRAHTTQRVIDVILGALSQALPSKAVAAANGANTTAVFTGTHPHTKERYVYLETLGGGFGARATRDGKDGVQVHITNTSNLPVEVIESEYPLIVESYSLVPESGGAGKQRGGLGLRRVIRPVGHVCTFSGSGERFVNQPWGLFGGKPGKTGSFEKRFEDGSFDRLPNKPSGTEFAENEAVIISTPGAGGYGSPSERTHQDIEDDLVSEKYSASFVKEVYGK